MNHCALWNKVVLATIIGVAFAGCNNLPLRRGERLPSSDKHLPSSSALARPYQQKDILLGEYSSLTGSTAAFGQSAHKGTLLAIEQANAGGGILGKKVRVQVEDDHSSSEEAATVVKKLINSNGVLAIVGEIASSRSLAAAPICQTAGVPMISPASTNPAVTQVGNYIFRVCFIDPFQGRVGATFARKNLKAKTAAVFTDRKSDYSVGLSELFVKEFTRQGGVIVANSSYSEGDRDFRSQLTTVRAKNADLLYIPGYYTEVSGIARQARSLSMKQPILGGDGWDSPKLFELSRGALEGCYFSTHYSAQSQEPQVRAFVGRYKSRFGRVPDTAAALSYDATRIVLAAIAKAGTTDRKKVRDALASTKNFSGITGKITFDQNRNPVKPAVIVQVRKNQFSYYTTVKL